eukprot:TRINITY_DN9747_c0_g1_i1.p1 TRINITY_DN9747_c0_g1~~TRINITY_DN9747_c0_g1_i1.p1  ORF type:complete len:115 (+),score=31.49 TRINITY_DN9747_c0_g1_i1:96-440(+)
MGNCAMVYSDDFSELTTERLCEAVQHMNATEVERCLEGGVPVNHPIDRYGHTILDKFALEHAAMLEQALHIKAQPKEATTHLLNMQEAAAQTLKTLVEYGATVSAQSGTLKRGV